MLPRSGVIFDLLEHTQLFNASEVPALPVPRSMQEEVMNVMIRVMFWGTSGRFSSLLAQWRRWEGEVTYAWGYTPEDLLLPLLPPAWVLTIQQPFLGYAFEDELCWGCQKNRIFWGKILKSLDSEKGMIFLFSHFLVAPRDRKLF